MNFDRIPQELRDRNQWVVWNYEYPNGMNVKPTKVPYSPLLNCKASVTSPHTWCSFDEAVRAFERGECSGIGFVLSRDDPFAFIDLDDTNGNQELLARQQTVQGMFNSYAERSPSGKGLHIIVLGNVERGRKRSQIEVYSSERFMTMTGDVFNDVPIVDCQVNLMSLWHEMGGPATVYNVGMDAEEKESDHEIKRRMFDAENGDKAASLFNGDWQNDYPSQSEADQALMNIIAFYTQNRFQIMRIFRDSELGKREKAARNDYLTFCINRAFDRQLPPVDVDGLKVQFDDMLARLKEGGSTLHASGEPPSNTNGNRAEAVGVKQPLTPVQSGVNTVPGLVGEIADFVYEAAPRPVREIALVAGLGLMAGIAGRSFNISGAGLNQYLMICAPTGTGKEAINNGISKIITACRDGVPSAPDFIGPGEIRSDAALLKWLTNHQCFVSVSGEFGLRMKQLCHDRAGPHEVGLRRVLLDLYGKSGAGNTLNPMAYSDKEKTTKAINSPSFTMIGESTPQRFYEALEPSMVYEGMLPRFTVFEFNGSRPELNQNAFNVRPGDRLVERIKALMVLVRSREVLGQVANVDGDSDARRVMTEFNAYCDSQMHAAGQDEILLGFWSRAWLKAMKLSATVAVGVDYDMPTVTGAVAQWACDTINTEVLSMVSRFTNGLVGGDMNFSENAQLQAILSTLAKWFTSDDPNVARSYGLVPAMTLAKCFTVSSLQQRLASNKAFKGPNMRPSNEIKKVVEFLKENGVITRLSPQQANSMFSSSASVYQVVNPEPILKAL